MSFKARLYSITVIFIISQIFSVGLLLLTQNRLARIETEAALLSELE